jgi:hypothetical protein
MAKNNNYSAMTLVGLGVLGMMAYAFLAPKILSKPKVAVPAPVAEVDVPVVPVQAGQVAPPVTVGVPNNMDSQAMDDLNMNFAGVTFAENIPGMSYGFPLSGIV